MRLRFGRLASTALLLALASASAGASATRPAVALTASPAHVELSGAKRATVRVTNAGTERVAVDVGRAGFALDLRGKPKIVARERSRRSAADWLSIRPRTLRMGPGASAAVTIASRLPSRVEPGDHDALLLLTSRRRVKGGVAVRMRLGVVVVVRAPGTIVRRHEARGLSVVRYGSRRVLELMVANRGNVTESFTSKRSVLSLFRGGRRLARLTAVPRDLRPGTDGVLQFRYAGAVRGRVSGVADVSSESGRHIVRRFRVRL
jgi:hypothetical protein